MEHLGNNKNLTSLGQYFLKTMPNFLYEVFVSFYELNIAFV